MKFAWETSYHGATGCQARLDLDALAWAEIENEDLGPAAMGVATREDTAMVIAWMEG